MRSIPEERSDRTRTLSDEHRRMLEIESAITREVWQARGYYSADCPDEVPECFPKWQRRKGLVIPTNSPTGRVHYQLRPDRPKRDRKTGRVRKYEQPAGSSLSLDHNPLMLEEIRSGSGSLWITEGSRKVDALASVGIPALGIIGVYCFAVPKTKGTVPLPDFDAVRLRGRDVVLCYDADARTNYHVQTGLRRLAALLRKLGARKAFVVYLPEVPTLEEPGKAGVDDFLAAGHTCAELEALVEPFKPVDVGAERIRRSPELAEAVEQACRLLWERPASRGGRGDPSEHKLLRAMLQLSPERGKVRPKGLLVEASIRELAERAGMSTRTAQKAAKRLEAAGVLRRVKRRAGRKAGGFLLLIGEACPRADVPHNESVGAGRESRLSQQRNEFRESLTARVVHLRAPALMASSPGWKPRKKCIEHARKTGSVLPPAREPVKRPGPRVGQALDVYDSCEQTGMVPTDAEAAAALGIKRVRDYRRRTRAQLRELGLLTEDGSLAAKWLESLELIREHGEEQAAGRRLRELHARERQKYREHLRAQPEKHHEPRQQYPRETRRYESERVATLVRQGMDERFIRRNAELERCPERRRAHIADAMVRLFAERPEYRHRRAGQITCALPDYLAPDFPRGPDGLPKDHEVEALLDGVAA